MIHSDVEIPYQGWPAMQGCKRRIAFVSPCHLGTWSPGHPVTLFWATGCLLLATLSGCSEARSDSKATSADVPPAVELGRDFDPTVTGTLQGKVTWDGPIPDVPPFRAYPAPDSQPDLPRRGPRDNLHAPRINPANRGVAQAVVFLRQVDLRKSRPWNHEPVRVEQHDWTLSIIQGAKTSNIGFVRRGQSFTAVSKQYVLHILRGNGAAFFSMPFPDPDVVSTRRLDKVGAVELSSGADYFWMRAHLFVDDHPYYTCSDADGRFVLNQVPAGTYQLVCWLPNWNVAWRERDPENGEVSRLAFRPLLVIEKQVTVKAGETGGVNFVVVEKNVERQ